MNASSPLEVTDPASPSKRSFAQGLGALALGLSWGACTWPGQNAHAAPASSTSTWPARQKWTYRVEGRASGIPYRTESSLVLNLEAGQYQLVNEVRLPFLGSQIQTSAGRWSDAQGPQPQHFSDSKRKERDARFEASQGQIVFVSTQLKTAWVQGVQDRTSLLLTLAHRCMVQAHELKAGLRWTVPVISSSGVDPWALECQGLQSLELPIGRMSAWQWDRVNLTEGEAALSLWMSPSSGFGPARLLMVQSNGDRADQRLSQWDRSPN